MMRALRRVLGEFIRYGCKSDIGSKTKTRPRHSRTRGNDGVVVAPDASQVKAGLKTHSAAFTPTAFAIFAHLVISSRTNYPNSAGLLPTGSSPNWFIMRPRTSGTASARTTSAFILSLNAVGVLAGASMPDQITA